MVSRLMATISEAGWERDLSEQTEEAADCSGTGHSIAYMRHVERTAVNVTMLCWEPV
jgi:hypothetical protein